MFWRGVGWLLGRCPDAEFVAVGVGELGPFAPGFRAQLFGQGNPTSFERFTGCFNVVSVQDIAGEAGFVATHLAAQAEHDVGLCSRRSHLEPALRCAHGLIGDLLKTQCVDIKVEGLVLVAHANADGTDFCEHVYLLSLVAQTLRFLWALPRDIVEGLSNQPRPTCLHAGEIEARQAYRGARAMIGSSSRSCASACLSHPSGCC